MRLAYYLPLIAFQFVSCSSPRTSAPVIDPSSVFELYDWWDNQDWEWYTENIPFIETPDAEIDEVYYYRWELVTKHLTYGSPATGYLFTEFIDRPFWSGTYGGIACPLGHQMTEVRWLKDYRIIDDFARYWIDTPGALPRNYTNWYANALWQTYGVLGDEDWIVSMLPYMEEQFEGWTDEHFDPEHGMFFWNGLKDGMETNINSRLTDDEFSGAEGYRPTLNAYMVADARAIASTANLAGDPTKAEAYRTRARNLRQRVIDELWDERRKFFLHQFVFDEKGGIEAKTRTYDSGPYAGNEHGRELIGYIPWQFNIPDAEHSVAWTYLMDPEYFFAPNGPTTTERNDPQFLISPTCCVWSGNSWPFATTQTLVAFANLLDDYEQDYVDKEDYFKLLKVYTATHRKNGRPYIAESANPDTGSWFGSDMANHSEHYFHSGYIDLILSGLLGIRPDGDDTLRVRPLVPDDWDYFAVDRLRYHGMDVSVIWDRTGEKYGRGTGLSIFANGRLIGRSERLGPLDAPLPAVSKTRAQVEVHRPNNVAVNNGAEYPVITASYSYPANPPFYANDGARWYHEVPVNRWTTIGSPDSSDWLEIDFGAAQAFSSVKLYFLEDETGLKPPERFSLEVLQNGEWMEIPGQSRSPEMPAGRRANLVSFEATQADRVRAVFVHAAGARTGVTEFEVWADEGVPIANPVRQSPNLAFNDGSRPYPSVTASFASDPDGLSVLQDGKFGLTTYQANRWTALGSPNETDWIEVNFGNQKAVSGIDVYLWGNAVRYLQRIDDRVREPLSLRVQYRGVNEWLDVPDVRHFPERPETMALNRITFEQVETGAVRVVFEHALPGVSGATEIRIW